MPNGNGDTLLREKIVDNFIRFLFVVLAMGLGYLAGDRNTISAQVTENTQAIAVDAANMQHLTATLDRIERKLEEHMEAKSK